MRVLLAGFGSRGDLQPLVALGLGLVDAGHEVRFVGSPNGQAMVEGAGIPFRPLGVDFKKLLHENAASTDNPVKTLKTLSAALMTQIDLLFEGIREEVRGEELAVGSPLALSLDSASLAEGLPCRILLYAPLSHRTAAHPPMTMPLHGLPGWLNKLLFTLNDLLFQAMVGPRANRWRRAWGLAPVRSPMDIAFPHGRCVLVTDPVLAPLPDDVVGPVQTAALHLPQLDPLAPEIEAFLAAGPAVYVGFGSMPDADARSTTSLVVDAAALAGVRVLLSKGWADLGGETPEHVLTIGGTPHAVLFPRLAGVVHHGGSGTTQTAACAGVPQLVVPHLLDQFYWRKRVDALGLGPRAPDRRKLSSASLGAALSALTSGAYDEAARVQGERMAQQRGVEETVRLLERVHAEA